jgi:hypothetical protein
VKGCPMRHKFETDLAAPEDGVVGDFSSLHPSLPASQPAIDLSERVHFYPPLEEWSTATHRFFPLAFRQSVRCVLLTRALRPAAAVATSTTAASTTAGTGGSSGLAASLTFRVFAVACAGAADSADIPHGVRVLVTMNLEFSIDIPQGLLFITKA